MTVYYNEFDKYAADWLRNLIAAGLIAPGVVDTRSIEDVHPDDLRDFTQCHFFAGIGVWSYALRAAGWTDDRPVWTGSCPCQPFSAAGEGAGFADERHLWPHFYHLITEHTKWLRAQKRLPPSIFGEQVASKDADPWIDLVHTDMEALGYAFGAVPFPSAGIGAPHIRDRNYWVAYADHEGLEGWGSVRKRATQRAAGTGGVAGRLADASGERLEGIGILVQPGQPRQTGAEAGWGGETSGLADTEIIGRREERSDAGGFAIGDSTQGRSSGPMPSIADHGTGPTNGFWRDADWLGCTDGKWRPVEPGTSPLAHGLAAGMGTLSPWQRRLAEMAGLDAASLKRAKGYRVGSLRGYGNAINADAAIVWIEAVMASERQVDRGTAQEITKEAA